ncbi:class I SAM-dependent methyltransferase [Natrialba sp. PRR66]|uniref:class I SAM-dependent methyltransferase n=1 Tax=Natrialba sp. PRR66 TaxID=3098146 RepID=UPI002B1DB93C|nr:class I SAM-dependent methyltransferase [Natrialba sp. PRR66]
MTTEEGPIAKDAYDKLADTYAQDVENSAYNAHLEFPGTTALIPDVDGKQILDAGCGNGRYTEWLLDQGGEVVAIDVSTEMLTRATERCGGRAEFHQADLGAPLDFATADEFDGIVSGLALDYVQNWHQPFTEFARLLKPGGFFVFSVIHPLDEYNIDGDMNYFEVEQRTKEWEPPVPYYRRPFSDVLSPLLETGFRVDAITEPQPTDAFKEQRPERFEKESKQPVFLCLRAVRRES